MARNYHRNLAKTREAVRKRVSRHHHANITKSREAVNKRVKQCYQRNLSQSRAISCTSTARQYMKDLLESRSKSRYTSSLAYRKKAEAIRRGERDRYSLEPKKVEVTCLIKYFQGTFSADKKITSKLMKALKKVQIDLQPNGRPVTKHAACKLAFSHLVRYALQIRRKAVGSLLGIKKNIMELQLYNKSDLGQCQPGSLTLLTQHISKLMFLHPLQFKLMASVGSLM